jgi:FkbM family methyltransferase
VEFTEQRRYEYELGPTSVVLDVGAYEGTFTRTIHERYGCQVFAFEPIRAHYEQVKELASPSVEVFNFGIGASDRSERISVRGDSSSIFDRRHAEAHSPTAAAAPAEAEQAGHTEQIEIRSLARVLDELDLHYVDLLKLNVEGCEYEILEQIVRDGLAERFENIQVQFHDVVSDAAARREAIRAGLAGTHRLTYDEPFVWENHERKHPRTPLAVATLFRNEARFLHEWVEYHLLVGVERFWLYDDSSTDGWRDVLAPYIEAGTVEVIDWPVGSRNDYMRRQVESQRDAIIRARGEARWLALIDIDEYLLPRGEDTVVECLEKNYAAASAVYVNWHNFGTGGVHLDRAGPTLTRLTACAEPLHSRNAVGKSIVRPERVDAGQVWYPHHVALSSGSDYYDGDGRPIAPGKSQPELDGKVHDGLIRLNHYSMRDEAFFRSTRIGTGSRVVLEEEALLWEHHAAFSEHEDEEIVEFIRERHPASYAALWARPAEDWPMLGPYVSARIYGRLGNNMFQIAAASATAWDHGAEPVFPDLDAASEQYGHVLFRCNVGPDLDEWPEWNEPSFAYSPIEYAPNRRLVGYFQSERYFAHHRERIKALFRPAASDAAHIEASYGELLSRPRTVGVQLRYYRDEDAETYPQYGARYLELAAAQFPSDTTFVLSSDNLEHLRASIPASMNDAVVLEGEPDYIDLYVLSRCRDNVISNSTFGWWAAWLNENPQKRVIRPRRWINGLPEDDVCPPEWTAIDAPED